MMAFKCHYHSNVLASAIDFFLQTLKRRRQLPIARQVNWDRETPNCIPLKDEKICEKGYGKLFSLPATSHPYAIKHNSGSGQVSLGSSLKWVSDLSYTLSPPLSHLHSKTGRANTHKSF